jgi:peptidoglycan/xylan/chitin deacetylase (PgdA/CDA1 family)
MKFEVVSRAGYGAKKRMLTYKGRKHAPVWPNGATMAVLVYIAAEQWQWSEHERQGSPRVGPGRNGGPQPVLSTRTAINYGFEVGMPRMFDIISRANLPLTLWTSGIAAEEFPDVIRDAADRGFEIGGHSYSQGRYLSSMSPDEQLRAIVSSRELLRKVSGTEIIGHIGPSAVADAATLRILAEEGFLYNADLQDDELPYLLEFPDGKQLVEIPYRMMGNINDYQIYERSSMSSNEKLEYLISTFDAYLAASRETPLLFNFGTHPFVSGRPETAAVFAEFIRYIGAAEGVWMATYGEVAKWWLSLAQGTTGASE